MLYHAHVGSRLRYGIILWGNSSHAKDVFLCQKRVVRCMLGLHSTTSCREVFKNLKILTVTSVYIYEMCVYVYKNKDTFVRNRDIHGLNTRSRDSYYIDFARLDVSRNLPGYLGLDIFNRLPESVKCQPTLARFKNQLKLLLLQHSFYNLNEFCSEMAGG